MIGQNWFAFVFVGINQPQRSVDQCCIKTLRFYFGWAHAAFDILVKNFVEYGIVETGCRCLLIRPQFGTWNLIDNVLRNCFAVTVNIISQRVYL